MRICDRAPKLADVARRRVVSPETVQLVPAPSTLVGSAASALRPMLPARIGSCWREFSGGVDPSNWMLASTGRLRSGPCRIERTQFPPARPGARLNIPNEINVQAGLERFAAAAVWKSPARPFRNSNDRDP